MANKWNCDDCGIETTLNPEREPVPDMDNPVIDPKTKKPLINQKTGKPVYHQKLKKQKYQHPITGEMIEREIPEFRDLQERAYIVRLKIGDEVIQRDFCKKCLDKRLPDFKATFESLEKVGNK